MLNKCGLPKNFIQMVKNEDEASLNGILVPDTNRCYIPVHYQLPEHSGAIEN